MNDKIVVKMSRFGIGNQLFLYTYARFLCDKYNKKLYIYFPRKMGHNTDYKIALSKYNLQIDKVINKKELIFLCGDKLLQYYLILIIVKYILRKKNAKIWTEKKYGERLRHYGIIINFDVDHYEEYFNQILSKRNLIIGYYQMPHYAKKLQQKILKHLTLKQTDNYLREKIKELYNCQSVCLHIRRGDYVGNVQHDICDENYFQRAISEIKDRVVSPTFYIFSDDIDYIKNNIEFSKDIKVVYLSEELQKRGKSASEELYLMGQCRHFILSNSSFSWWAQFMCNNLNKIVIAPSRWYRNELKGLLSDEEWICLK